VELALACDKNAGILAATDCNLEFWVAFTSSCTIALKKNNLHDKRINNKAVMHTHSLME
jgi:hypothetical protein